MPVFVPVDAGPVNLPAGPLDHFVRPVRAWPAFAQAVALCRALADAEQPRCGGVTKISDVFAKACHAHIMWATMNLCQAHSVGMLVGRVTVGEDGYNLCSHKGSRAK